MYRSAMGVVKGLGFGVLACVAAVAIGSHQMRKSRRFRRNANRTMRTMDHLMDNVGHMLR